MSEPQYDADDMQAALMEGEVMKINPDDIYDHFQSPPSTGAKWQDLSYPLGKLPPKVCPDSSALRAFRLLLRPCLVLIWKRRADHWVCLYRLLIPLDPPDIRGTLIRLKLGETKAIPGDPAWTPCRDPDDGMMLCTPFRDGVHIRRDALTLRMPAFVVFGKLCESIYV